MALTRNNPAFVRCLLIGMVAFGLPSGLLPNYLAADAEKADAAAIRPFLQRHCIDCHGPDSAKAGLRLDAAEGAHGWRMRRR
jgi:hypothetical protein